MFDKDSCSTCLKNKPNLKSLTKLDTDNVSFLDKLRICIISDLELSNLNSLQICPSCIVNLNMFLKFRQKVLQSLKIMNYDYKTNIALDIIEDDYEGTVNDFNLQHIKDEALVNYTLEIEDENSNGVNDSNIITVEESVENLIQNETQHSVDVESCPLISNQCNRKKSTRNNKTNYLKRSYCCMYCGNEYTTLINLREHIATHTGEKNYSCKLCDKTFHRQSCFKRHLKTHLKPLGQKTERTPFLCTICGKNFPFSNGAARHMRVHSGIKRHECQVCHKKFNQSTHLNVHMRTHNGEKPYICERCGETFPLKAALDKHIKTKHKEKNECNKNIVKSELIGSSMLHNSFVATVSDEDS